MATVSDDPFSDCSIAFLLPRTLGGSISAGASLSDSDDQAFIGSIFKATVGKNFTQLLENAKMISNSNCSIISNKIHEKEDNILGKRTLNGQVEAQHKRVRQRRPGLPSSARGGNIFNVSSNTIAVKASQIGTAEFSKRRLSSTESRFADNQAVPVIDYSCLENIKDPTEYFSTYRMLENAEKEVKKLCGNTSLNLSQHQVQRNRLRRRGLSELAGKKYVFKFPGTDSTVEASQKESSSLSNAVDITELITSSSSKKIIQTENLLTVEPKIKLGGTSKTSDLNVEEDELDRLLSKCKELDNDELGIGNLVRDTLQINPIHVEKLNVFSFSALTKSTYESTEPRPLASFKKGHKPVGFSDLKDCLTVINQQGDPLSLLSRDGEQWSDGSKELGSSSMDCCDVGKQMLSYNKSGIQDELEKLKRDFKGHRVDDIPKSEQDNLQAKLLDAKEMTNLVDNLSIFEKSVPLIDIQGRLDKITSLNSHILQRNAESENLQFSDNDFESFSSSKYREVSQVDTVHHDGSFLDTQTTRDRVLSHEKRLCFEDAIHSPVIQNLDDNKVVCHEKTSDSNACQSSFPEETCQTSDVFSYAKELASDFDFVDVIVDAPEQQLHTHSPELQLHPEVRKDQDRSEIPTVMDEQIDDRSNIVSAKNESQRHSGGSGESRPRKLKRKKQIMNRKSLSGAGTIWEMGVRRSTRIRVKPLQFWCGERLLYGRVHDSLATVIGVKTVGTPEAGKQAVMKVKSFVSEQYADLVAQAALH